MVQLQEEWGHVHLMPVHLMAVESSKAVESAKTAVMMFLSLKKIDNDS